MPIPFGVYNLRSRVIGIPGGKLQREVGWRVFRNRNGQVGGRSHRTSGIASFLSRPFIEEMPKGLAVWFTITVGFGWTLCDNYGFWRPANTVGPQLPKLDREIKSPRKSWKTIKWELLIWNILQVDGGEFVHILKLYALAGLKNIIMESY